MDEDTPYCFEYKYKYGATFIGLIRQNSQEFKQFLQFQQSMHGAGGVELWPLFPGQKPYYNGHHKSEKERFPLLNWENHTFERNFLAGCICQPNDPCDYHSVLGWVQK